MPAHRSGRTVEVRGPMEVSAWDFRPESSHLLPAAAGDPCRLRRRGSRRGRLVVALVLGGIVVLAGIAVVALLGTLEDPAGTTPTGPQAT
ncbi:hypothetical protein ACWGQ4_00645 [Streptomyces sp. NPDC055721]|uniref:hypothetical protein n=1 Tax=Streptomyces sp. NPDC127132 TaxID=3345374 RepID=UPI003624E58F